MLESSLKIGSVAGIRIGIHYTWLVVFVLISWTLNEYFAASHPHWSSTTTLTASVVSALLFFGSIILHELGHFLVAKASGMRVLRFSLGFGPKIWERQIGETTWKISPILIGGYVQVQGMGDPEEESSDDPRSYQNRPRWPAYRSGHQQGNVLHNGVHIRTGVKHQGNLISLYSVSYADRNPVL